MSIAADDANAFKTCDANEDGRISIKDATIVQKYIVGGYETGNVGLPISVE
jgi:Ca2+-binding EF-hand superfamily protein